MQATPLAWKDGQINRIRNYGPVDFEVSYEIQVVTLYSEVYLLEMDRSDR